MERFTFHKSERLCSRKIIAELFASGQSFLAYPFKVVFIKTELPESGQVQVTFSVSKRNFKRAVKRNILKRRMREAYRLNKSSFYDGLFVKNVNIAMIFIYVGKEISEYATIEKGIVSAFNKVLGKV